MGQVLLPLLLLALCGLPIAQYMQLVGAAQSALLLFTPQMPPGFSLCSLPGQLPILRVLRVTEARLLKLLGTSRTPTCLLDGSAR